MIEDIDFNYLKDFSLWIISSCDERWLRGISFRSLAAILENARF